MRTINRNAYHSGSKIYLHRKELLTIIPARAGFDKNFGNILDCSGIWDDEAERKLAKFYIES